MNLNVKLSTKLGGPSRGSAKNLGGHDPPSHHPLRTTTASLRDPWGRILSITRTVAGFHRLLRLK